ncbi:MAG: acyltransferase [Lachnospiraceae bacterium]|nr:acyltransferase [Lachnospiraceae bacterium]
MWLPKYRKFGKIDYTSYVIKPMRLIGAKHIRIGKNVAILNQARIECIRNKKCKGEVIIKDRTSIEQCCHIIAGNKLVIGKDVTISAFVYIADTGHGMDDMSMDVMKQPLVVKHTEIKDGAFIGIGARIMPGVTVGKHAVVGANAVVTHDVPDYAMVAGAPAKIIKMYDTEKKTWKKA